MWPFYTEELHTAARAGVEDQLAHEREHGEPYDQGQRYIAALIRAEYHLRLAGVLVKPGSKRAVRLKGFVKDVLRAAGR